MSCDSPLAVYNPMMIFSCFCCFYRKKVWLFFRRFTPMDLAVFKSFGRPVVHLRSSRTLHVCPHVGRQATSSIGGDSFCPQFLSDLLTHASAGCRIQFSLFSRQFFSFLSLLLKEGERNLCPYFPFAIGCVS